MIEKVLDSIQDSPVQEWKTMSRRRIWIKREDRSAFGLGTKIRRFKGFLELNRNLPVLLKGSLNSNFLSAFCLLFRLAGYRTHTLATARNLKDIFANAKLVQSLSHNFEIVEEKNFNVKLNEKQSALSQGSIQEEFHIIPKYGFSHLAIKGMDSLWDEIDWDRYTHIVMDMGTGLGFLSGLDYLQRHPKNHIHFIGILLGEKMSSWFRNLPMLLENLKLNFNLNPYLNSNFDINFDENLASQMQIATNLCSSIKIFSSPILPRFGKQNSTLLDYIRRTYRETGIPLEPFYSAKSLFTLEKKIMEFPEDSEILYIHQGGLLQWVDLFE